MPKYFFPNISHKNKKLRTPSGAIIYHHMCLYLKKYFKGYMSLLLLLYESVFIIECHVASKSLKTRPKISQKRDKLALNGVL